VAQVAVCSQINTKHINTVWAERTVVVKPVVHHVTSRLEKVKESKLPWHKNLLKPAADSPGNT
jgi:hypothetical protein